MEDFENTAKDELNSEEDKNVDIITSAIYRLGMEACAFINVLIAHIIRI